MQASVYLMFIVYLYVYVLFPVTVCPARTLATLSLDLPSPRCYSFTLTSWPFLSSSSRVNSTPSAPGNSSNTCSVDERAGRYNSQV